MDLETLAPEEVEEDLSNACGGDQYLFVMVTGRFSGTFAGVSVSLMVDTGSELNLVSRRCYDLISLPIDLDGTRWSLKGIHGRPVLGDWRRGGYSDSS